MNVIVFVNPNSFNEASLTNNEAKINLELIKSATASNYNVVDQVIPKKRLHAEEILSYIYSNTNEEFQAIYVIDKANLSAKNDDVIKLVYNANEEKNVQIITQKEGNITLDVIASQKFIIEKQKEKKSQQAYESRIKGTENGIYTGGKVPFGYLKNPFGQYEINIKEAQIIKEMFSMYALGVRAINIARVIGDKYDLKYKSRNSYWKADRIFGYLTNPMYNGFPTVNRTTKNEKGNTVNLPRSEWSIAPTQFDNLIIVDDDIFAQVQQRLWHNDEDKPIDFKLDWENEKQAI